MSKGVADADGITGATLAASGVPLWLSSALGVYALMMYGVAYYAIGTAAPAMAKEFGIATSAIFAMFSIGLLLNAALAPWVGKLIDRVGAGRVLLIGAVARACAILAMAFSIDVVTLLAAILVTQIFAHASEYEATFAAAVEFGGAQARTAISVITLWGGFASTAFWPLTAWLLQNGDWRNLFVIYAGLLAVVCIPIAAIMHIRSLRRPTGLKTSGESMSPPTASAPDAAAVARSRAHLFLPLTIAFALGSVASGLPVMLLPVLEGLGLGAGAVLAAVVFGPAQTAGRFFELMFGQSLRPITVAVIAAGLVPISFCLLLLGGTSSATAVAFALLFGAAIGVSYVVRGTVVLTLLGADAYATSLGRIARTRLVVAAVTPFALALMFDHFGAVAVVVTCAATAAAAAVVFWFVARTSEDARAEGTILSFKNQRPSNRKPP
jgi:MFS family permease